MARMRFLIDENVPDSVADFLRQRGHEVELVRDVLLRGSPDQLVVFTASLQESIVVTLDRDFKSLIQRMPEGSRGTVRYRTGRISLRCNPVVARQRIETLIERIEFEYELAQREDDPRLIVEISETTYRVNR